VKRFNALNTSAAGIYKASADGRVDFALPRGMSMFERRKQRLPSDLTLSNTVVKMNTCPGANLIFSPASDPLQGAGAQ
jgi:hypothetical protein